MSGYNCVASASALPSPPSPQKKPSPPLSTLPHSIFMSHHSAPRAPKTTLVTSSPSTFPYMAKFVLCKADSPMCCTTSTLMNIGCNLNLANNPDFCPVAVLAMASAFGQHPNNLVCIWTIGSSRPVAPFAWVIPSRPTKMLQQVPCGARLFSGQHFVSPTQLQSWRGCLLLTHCPLHPTN